MASSLLKFSLKTNLVKSVISEIASNISRYYYVYCHPGAWTNESIPEPVSDSFEYENNTRNEAILYKQIDANDICAVIPRINWIAGYTFDMYGEYSSDNPAFSGATALENAEFYCLTDDYNVYKCLFNNNDNPSSVRPTGTSTVPITLDDGYIWKYMYTVPLSVRNKFLTATTMPVVTALSNQFYSKGSIVSFTIENPGKKYPITSYKVTGFRIIDGGSGYASTPTITLSNPDQSGGVPATVGSVTLSGGQVSTLSISNQGSGYSYPPIVTVTGGGASRQATLEPIVTRLSNVYTTLTVTGDGYLEENPYQVQSIQVVTGGTGYATATLLFTDPDLPGGIRAAATATISGGMVTGFTVTNPGYGYSKPFNSTLQDPNNTVGNIVLVQATSLAGQTASGLTFRVTTKKNEAELVPLINANGEIQSIQITKPGIGYTYALVTVNTSLDPTTDPDFEAASILLNFGIGDIESRQSTVELTAVDGAIHVIDVVNPGFGYTSAPTVTVIGDGSGCTAHAVLSATGGVQKIAVDSIGYNYTKATVTITGPSASPAIGDIIISPKGGHGRDAISELYSKTLVFHGNLSKEKNKGFTATNDYRQVCIIKNPKIYGKEINLRSALSSTCLIAIGTKGQNGFGLLNIDDIVSWTDTTVTPNRTYTFRVIEKNSNYSTTEAALLLSYLDNKIPNSGATFSKVGAVFSTTNIITPDVNKFSGDLLTIDNRLRFSPSDQQIVVVTNSITF
jgi:hypothetical protein